MSVSECENVLNNPGEFLTRSAFGNRELEIRGYWVTATAEAYEIIIINGQLEFVVNPRNESPLGDRPLPHAGGEAAILQKIERTATPISSMRFDVVDEEKVKLVKQHAGEAAGWDAAVWILNPVAAMKLHQQSAEYDPQKYPWLNEQMMAIPLNMSRQELINRFGEPVSNKTVGDVEYLFFKPKGTLEFAVGLRSGMVRGVYADIFFYLLGLTG